MRTVCTVSTGHGAWVTILDALSGKCVAQLSSRRTSVYDEIGWKFLGDGHDHADRCLAELDAAVRCRGQLSVLGDQGVQQFTAITNSFTGGTGRFAFRYYVQ